MSAFKVPKIWGNICPICNWWGHPDHDLKQVEIVRYKNLKGVKMGLKRINVLVGRLDAGDANNQYLISTYDETVLMTLVEKAPEERG